MKRPELRHITNSTPIGEIELIVQDTPTRVKFELADVINHDFPFVVMALSDDYRDEILGFSGFNTRDSMLGPNLLELRMVKVDPAYFQSGIGRTLLTYSRKVAQDKDKLLILEPRRPGEGVAREYRDRDYPLTTEQLRDVYLRNGFRTLAPAEVDELTKRIDEEYLTHSLWFEGIDPDTKRLTGKHRYSMDPKIDGAKLAHILFDEKIALLKAIVGGKGNYRAVESNMKSHRRKVEKYLIEVRPS